MNWFDEYKKLYADEREYYKDYLCDEDQRTTVMNYERFVESLKFIEKDPIILKEQMDSNLNIGEEVALSFENEALYISQKLYDIKIIDNDVMKMIQQINDLFDQIDEDNKNDWSLEYLINDDKWKCIRYLTKKILAVLNEFEK